MTKKTSPAYRASKEETIPINKLHPFSNHPFHIRHDLEFSGCDFIEITFNVFAICVL